MVGGTVVGVSAPAAFSKKTVFRAYL